MEKPIVAIVPALPGFSLAYFEPEHAHHVAHFLYVPVIAWRVDEDGCASQSNSYPIGADGETNHDWDTHPIIRYPDGRFDFLHDAWCDNETTALVHAAERAVTWAALKAERDAAKAAS
jgi:hypothetical protein